MAYEYIAWPLSRIKWKPQNIPIGSTNAKAPDIACSGVGMGCNVSEVSKIE